MVALPPLDVGSAAVLDAISPAAAAAIERRLESLACAVPVAVAVFATRSSSGIPQIVEVLQSKTPKQVSSKWGPRVFFGDAVVYMSRMVYHLRRGYAVSCWSELIPLMLQNLACFYITRSRLVLPTDKGAKLLARPWAQRANEWLKLTLDAAFLVALGVFMAWLPSRFLPILCLWSTPLSIVSYAVQVTETVMMGPRSTSRSGWALRIRWFGSLVRVLTTMRFCGGDLAALSNHAVGFLGCSVLLLQRSVYISEGPTKQQTRYALYSQLLGEKQKSKLPRILDATLHAWRSLGGFGAARPPDASQVLCNRRAFDDISTQAGFISAADLTEALLQASSDNEDLSRTEAEELAKRMMSTADLDGNGLIDFEEYCAVVERAGPGD